MKNITIANKLDMSYDFYMKHKMHMIEWKLNKDKKNKNITTNFDWSSQ